jgi:hypothetical protein
MDDKREGRPSFKTSDVVKNEVRDVIDGDRRLTVREVADKCVISKTTVHLILVQELHMNRICARWVPRMLSEENMTNRGKLQSPLVLSPGCTYFFLKILSLLLFLAEESRHFSIDLIVALFPGHSSETMFHLWLLFYTEIQFRSG